MVGIAMLVQSILLWFCPEQPSLLLSPPGKMVETHMEIYGSIFAGEHLLP